MKRSPRAPRAPRANERGFTLAEVAVAIVIVGMGLIWILEGLNGAKLTAAHTRNYKLARDLALETLGHIESGELQEDVARGLAGSYGEEGYPDFLYEVIVGDESFRDDASKGDTFDSWAPRSQSQKDKATDDEEVDPDEKKEQEDQPFEKVKIKITFPKIREFTNELILERWIPWKQVYGESEKDKDAAASKATDANAQGGNAGSTNNAGSHPQQQGKPR